MLSPTDFYLLRCPSFSIQNLIILENAIKEKDVENVKKIFSHNFFLNAIYFSSKSFYNVAIEWLQSTNSIYLEDKVLISLYKYYNRLSTRSTPYGLFAGFSIGEINNKESAFEFTKSNNSFNYFIRPDMLYIEKLKQKHLKFNSQIKFHPNNTLYKIGNKIRFIEYDVDKNFSISDIDHNKIISQIISFTKLGKTFLHIKNFISSQVKIASEDEIEEYIQDLILSKILVQKTPPFITNSGNILNSLDQFFQEHGIESYGLSQITSKIEEVDYYLTNNISLFKFNKKYPDEDQDIQVDLKLDMDQNRINSNVVKLLCKDLNKLSQLSTTYKISPIEEFKNRFIKKYDAQEVLLVEALDPQIGIGYDLQVSGNVDHMPLIEQIEFSSDDSKLENPTSSLVNYVYRKYPDYFDKRHRKIIKFTDEDITQNVKEKNRNKSFFNHYYLLGKIIGENIKQLDLGNFKFYSLYSLPSPMMTTIYSRFAHSDKNLTDKLKRYVKTSENNTIYAEIIHQPDGRIGNVLLRPAIYEYEIPYVSHSNPKVNTINIQDLTIKIVRNRIVLRSKLLDKEIIPRLSSAHNFSREQLPLFRFLGDLQFADRDKPFKWNWTQLKDQIYLPRIEYNHIILALAQWKLFKDKDIDNSKLEELIEKNNIPVNCEIKDREDNVMKLDLSNPICQEILIKRLKSYDVTLYENIDSSPINSDGRTYNNEIAFSFIKKSINNHTEETPKKVKATQRSFLPGDEWTFLKIYCSHGIADEIIEKLSALFSKHKGIWHFIRYEDPDYHLRFRIKNSLHSEILSEVKKELMTLIHNKYISSISQDTYNRELERYGYDNISNTEEFFYYDSKSASETIKLISNSSNSEHSRWIAALISVDKIFQDFEITYEKRVKYIKSMFDIFQNEFVNQFDAESRILFNKSIDEKYKRYKSQIQDVLENDPCEEFQPIKEIFTDRSRQNKDVVKAIKSDALVEENFTYRLLSSYIHMTLNRLFLSKPRMHETVIYYFLFRAYSKIYHTNE